jgi:citrate lyase subunit beta/citryl-CoA lyase
MIILPPDLRRTWLFGPGADPAVHAAMLVSGADALIVDLEDFTPAERRPEARALLAPYVEGCRARGLVAAIRINQLDGDGALDLEAAMPCHPDVIALPMSERATQVEALDAAITDWESRLGIQPGSTELLPVCETALGVADLRLIATASPRIHCALLGAEDLASDLQAERGQDGVELDYARRRFLLECRAARIEPIDAPYTFADVEGAVREATYVRRLGYHSKSLVRPDHAVAVMETLTPGPEGISRAEAIVAGFTAARARGEDRALVEGLWVEVPAFRNAQRLLDRARRLGARA